MRRNSNDMQVNFSGLRRNVKNFAHNYSDAQKKVREATSNDHWGPSSTLMAEIADLTYNVVAFSEIMQMVWKRLNDHGKNWRHVYKALVLLEYLIKTGSEKVAQQCKENIYAIQTLKDFQHLEEGKDQGANVREKAKQLVILLKDDERLKNERARALKAKERFAQSASGFGSDGGLDTPTSPRYPAFRGDWSGSRDSTDIPREIEIARPQTAGEEELQLQLALAMSREEAEQEEQKRKSDDVRLQMALSQSQQDFKKSSDKINQKPSAMVDLLDVNLGESSNTVDPWGMPQPPRPQSMDFSLLFGPSSGQSSPWQGGPLASPPGRSSSATGDPWAPPSTITKADPWALPSSGGPSSPQLPLSPLNQGGARPHDPWSPTSHSSPDLDDFDIITNRNRPISPKTNGESNGKSDPFELNLLGESLPATDTSESAKKTPQSFLGENSALVNLDNLVTTNKPPTLVANPFSEPPPTQRAMFNTQPPKPSINEIKQQAFAQFTSSATQQPFGTTVQPVPVAPTAPSYGLSSSVGSAPFSSAFGTNNGMSFNTASAVQDPWTPMPSGPTAASSLNGNSPWMRSNEPANPFLS